mmetsp:Transcript_35132/g.110601  ORF Transcript_35132/g.110601 Transcript_35132/m.110601 type:complete len:342 (+) Transcript_35132:439-1464(+)
MSLGHRKKRAEKLRGASARVVPFPGDSGALKTTLVAPAQSPKAGEGDEEKKSWTWFIGTSIFICGSLLLFASFGFAPQSVLAALEAVQFITNIFFGKFVLGEAITKRMVLGTVALVGGMSLVVAFSKHETSLYSSEDLQSLYGELAYIVFLAFAGVTLIASRVLFNVYGARRQQGLENLPYHNLVYPISYCYFSAMIGTQQLLMAKCISNLLRLTGDGDNQFTHWFTYFCIAVWLLSAIYWVYRMDLGLKLFKGPFIIPVLQVHFTLLAIVSGGIYFKEFDGQPPGHICAFVAGCVIIFGGVYLLAPAEVEEPDGLAVMPVTATNQTTSATNQGACAAMTP